MKEPKRGDRVLVWNNDESKARERIYLCAIEGAKNPIQSVTGYHEEEFKSGQPFHTLSFKHMKPIAPEITVGKWYKKDRYLMVWNGGKDTYGFYRGDWGEEWSLPSAKNLVEATEEEVEEALIAEAKRIGYKEGNFYCLKDGFRWGVDKGAARFKGFCYYENSNRLSLNCGDVFSKGKWAKIVEPQNEYTVEELEKLTGIKDLKIKK